MPTKPPEAALNDLIDAARRGERSALQALFVRHAPTINRLVARLIGRRDEEVRDLVHDTFLEAFRSLHHLREPEFFGTWLGSIAIHLCKKKLRKRRLLARLGFTSASPAEVDQIASAAAPADVLMELRRVYAGLERLPVNLRVAFVLQRLEGRPLDEVAQLMNVSISTIKRWVVQADDLLEQARQGGDDEG